MQITMTETHRKELTSDVNHGKRHSRASYRVQITMEETHTRELTLEGVNRGKLQESLLSSANHNGRDTYKRDSKASIVAASCRVQITKAEKHKRDSVRRRQSWQASKVRHKVLQITMTETHTREPALEKLKV